MVNWSNPAKKSLRQIYEYISQDSLYYAKEVTDKIVSETEKLIEFPKIGRIVPELDNGNIRELIIYSYRLIYEITEKADIYILAVIHGRQLFPENIIK